MTALVRFVVGTFRRVGQKFNNCSKMYSTIERGVLNCQDYRVFLSDANGAISPFHDIPLFADKENQIYNMVVEVPRWTNAKMEIATKEPLNPIKQDIKKGNLRYVHNIFPHHGYIWNYGAIPQTWEDPNNKDESTGCKGDNDPIDVCEIGQRVATRGDILQIKVLGIMALIDEGETDWKVIAIDIEDPLAESVNDIDDVQKHMPGLLTATYEWFRYYKVPAGSPENQFAFNGQPKPKEFAEKIIAETHQSWIKLMENPSNCSGLSCTNVCVEGSSFQVGVEEAAAILEESPEFGPGSQPINGLVDKWHYLKELQK